VLQWLVKAYILLLMFGMPLRQQVVSTNTCESLHNDLDVSCKSANSDGDTTSCRNAFDGDVTKTQWIGVSAGDDAYKWPQLSFSFGTPRLSTEYVILPGDNSIGHNYSWMLIGSNDGIWGTILDRRDQVVSIYHVVVT